MTSISATSVSRNTASVVLSAPGVPRSRLIAVAAHAALSVVRPVAAPHLVPDLLPDGFSQVITHACPGFPSGRRLTRGRGVFAICPAR